ncbi:hypothetical protein J3Q64DRAFT_1855566 [Phycomyces blakesleeanus]|uniref:Uncharacterized protein n=1 Tax=Phycomyces blakesleeanus TaxID=4837 RepID=A0ABR3BF64_PHYBL
MSKYAFLGIILDLCLCGYKLQNFYFKSRLRNQKIKHMTIIKFVKKYCLYIHEKSGKPKGYYCVLHQCFLAFMFISNENDLMEQFVNFIVLHKINYHWPWNQILSTIKMHFTEFS